jgi:hypothetical protein
MRLWIAGTAITNRIGSDFSDNHLPQAATAVCLSSLDLTPLS